MKPIKEIPLIVFTVFTQAAVGLTLVSTVLLLMFPEMAELQISHIPTTAHMHPFRRDILKPLLAGAVALIVLGIGFASSIFHLGHPIGGVRSLSNLRFSWLSREILTFGVYGGGLLLDILLTFKGMNVPTIKIAVSLAGLTAVYTSARVYTNSGYPALNNPAPVIFFAGTTLTLGICLWLLIGASDIIQSDLAYFLLTVLVVETGCHVLVPSFWLSGSRVLKCSALNHYHSVYFWIRAAILLGIITGIMVRGMYELIFSDTAFCIIILIQMMIQELAGRILFFNHTVHTAEFIGKR